MKWYKKQLDEKLKKSNSTKKENGEEKSSTKPAFDPRKFSGKKKNFPSPVAAMNRNRKKTDLP